VPAPRIAGATELNASVGETSPSPSSTAGFSSRTTRILKSPTPPGCRPCLWPAEGNNGTYHMSCPTLYGPLNRQTDIDWLLDSAHNYWYGPWRRAILRRGPGNGTRRNTC